MMEPKKQNPKAPESQPEQKPQDKMIISEKNISDSVLNRVTALEEAGGLQMPPNYSAANALKSAWLILQNTVDTQKRPVLTSCDKTSITNTLFDMVVQGLNPVKKQCYFIPFDGKLSLMRSYHGTKAVARRHGAKDIFSNCIYEDDKFEYSIDLQTGLKQITKHDQSFENIDLTKIKGAWAIVTREGQAPYVEIMNLRQIKSAWEMGFGKGDTKAHKNFTDEMCKKTVESRACKTFINSSDDSDVLSESMERTLEAMPDTPYIEEKVEEEIKENANKELLDINPVKPEPKPIDTSVSDRGNGKAEPTLEGPGF